MKGLKNPLIVALDIDDPDRAIELSYELKDIVGAIKLGPRLVLRAGSGFIREISRFCPTFIDFKFYDIPSTMQSAVKAVVEEGATIVTVHASSGSEALSLMAQLQSEVQKERPFYIFAVTVLTSFDSATLPKNLKDQSIEKHVGELAELAKTSGLKNLVCSPFEIEPLLKRDPSFNLVTPGVRPSGSSSDDQKRIMTPKEAISLGASGIVVGRPILDSSNPIASSTAIANEICGK